MCHNALLVIKDKITSSLEAFKTVLEKASKAENFSLSPERVRSNYNSHFRNLNRKMLKTNVANIKKKNHADLYTELPQILAKIFITFTSSSAGINRLDQTIDTTIYKQEDTDASFDNGKVLKAKSLQLSHREFLWRLVDNACNSLEKIQLSCKDLLQEDTKGSFKKKLLNLRGKLFNHQVLGSGKSDRKIDADFLKQAGLKLADTLDTFRPENLKERIKVYLRSRTPIQSNERVKYNEKHRRINKIVDGLFSLIEEKGNQELDKGLVIEAAGIRVRKREIDIKLLLAFAEKMRKVFNEYGYLYATTIRDISDLLFSMLKQKPQEEINKALQTLKTDEQTGDLKEIEQSKKSKSKQL